MKWLKVIAMTPFALLVFLTASLWEWWHFGPSQRILHVTRNLKRRLFKWRRRLEREVSSE